jgi:hypothetical protein
MPPRRAGVPWWGWLGAAVSAAGAALLAADVPAWNTLWYLFGWYGWLLVLDALLERLGGASWLRHRRRELAGSMAWSIPFWYAFEAFNLRLKNWYYVFVLHDDRVQLVVSLLAFATVLPACFLHADLARLLLPLARIRWPPLRWGRGLELTLAALGVASVAAPLLWPRWAFPLVWGALLWLPELVNRRIGAPSLLADLEAGRPQRLLHLLGGGMLAGLVWEALNYPARCKWIYTVPFFDRLKLFEMPLLGFFGFPVLALSAFATWSWLAATLHGDLTAGAPTRRRLPGWASAIALLAALAASVFVYERVLAVTVTARRPLLEELTGLTAEDAMLLETAGLESPELLERAVAERGQDSVAASAGLPPAVLGPAASHAALALHKGMGTAAAALLQAAGVADIAALGEAAPDVLRGRLAGLAEESGLRAPRREEILVWVRAAEGRSRPRR